MGGGDHGEQGVYRSDDLAGQVPADDLDGADSGQVSDRRWVGREGRVDGERGQVTHLRQGADLGQPSGAQDGHPVAQGLHLVQDV